MGYQSKTYSLSDEVVAAIDDARAHGETPNQFLKRILGIKSEGPLTASTPVPLPTGISELPDYEIPPALDSSLTWRAGRKPLEKPKDRKKAAEK